MIVVTTFVTILAALVGGLLPLLALALLVRWRLAGAATRRYRPPRETERLYEGARPDEGGSPAEGERHSGAESSGSLGLGWLQASIGAPELRAGATRDELLRCHRCGHRQDAPAFFCARCRARLGAFRSER